MIAGATTFDELNALVVDKRARPYAEYFGGMDLSEDEIEEREELAESFERNFLPVIVLMFLMQLYGTMGWDSVKEQLYGAYSSAVEPYMVIDRRMEEYMRTFADEIVESTQAHMEDPYYFSLDRAQFVAENEANTSLEYRDFDRAMRNGMSRKQWRDVRDKRERETHLEVGGTILPIWEPFQVGGYLMMYPKDQSLGAGAEEIANCRCHAVYMR